VARLTVVPALDVREGGEDLVLSLHGESSIQDHAIAASSSGRISPDGP